MYWLNHGAVERVKVLDPTREELYAAVELAGNEPVAGSLLCLVKVLRTGEEIHVPICELEPSPTGPYAT